MLFEDSRLKSDYDFGETLPDGKSTIKALCDEISKITDLIGELLLDENGEVALKHHDNRNQIMRVPSESITNDDGDDKSVKDLSQIQKSLKSISKQLENFGIKEPGSDSEEYKSYLQVLYFFYMVRVFVFPEGNIFINLKATHRSSDNAPIERAGLGKFWYFIVSNALDDLRAARKYAELDTKTSRLISDLANILYEKINFNNGLNENINISGQIQELIDNVVTKSNQIHSLENAIDQLLAFSYQYHTLAYSEDMLRNLDEDKNPFQFSELEIPIKTEWKNRMLKEKEVRLFLKEPEVIEFCKQKSKEVERADKEIRANAFGFVDEILEYDRDVIEEYGEGLFWDVEDGVVAVRADYIALIVRTYMDLAADKKTKLLMQYKSGNKWRSEQTITHALFVGETPGKLQSDLAMKMFIVAFDSERMNAYCGYGYYYFFKCINLKRYVLLQKIVRKVFAEFSPGDWVVKLEQYFAEIKNIQ